MKNYIAPGNVVDVTAPTGGVVSGTAYLIGSMFGIATVSAAAGVVFPLNVTGIVQLPKATGTAWAVGDAVYWNNSTKAVGKASTGNSKIGVAASIQVSADTLGNVRLNGSF